MARPIILQLSRPEAEHLYKITEPIAMARPLFLNIVLAMRSSSGGPITLQLKRNTADQIRKIVGPIASARRIFLQTNDAIEAAGGTISNTL